jgi:hypothetical protein
MRVKADMPEWVSITTQCVLYVFLAIAAVAMMGHGVTACNKYERARFKPRPMTEGKCRELPLKRYEGEQENGQLCEWSGTRYWCVKGYGHDWVCEQTPAEKP